MNTPETMIVLPKIKKPTSGLVLATVRHTTKAGLLRTKTSWRACYIKDGSSRQKILNTEDLAEAITRRDALYAELRAAGATEVQPRASAYIYHRPPYVVKICGVWVGSYETKGEAETARDAYLANADVEARRK